MRNPLKGLLGDDREPRYPAWRWQALGVFNAERHRGLLHDPEYVELMRAEQEAFNADVRARFPQLDGVADEDRGVEP